MRYLNGIKTGGAAILLALVLAMPAAAQLPAPLPPVQEVPQEPAVARGVVAVRVLNATPCVMGMRVRENGVVKGMLAVPPQDWRSLHVRPDTSAMEVEILASPRLCARRDSTSTTPARGPVSRAAFPHRPPRGATRRAT